MNVFIKNVLYQWKPADCNMTADSHLIALQDRQDVLLRFAHSYFPNGLIPELFSPTILSQPQLLVLWLTIPVHHR